LIVEIWLNNNPRFTNWVTLEGLLQEPFVVVDVGVQGDASRRWNFLGDYLIFHGFDAIKEVIEQLQQRNFRPNRHYHWIAAGGEDYEQPFYFNSTNPTASSMYEQGASRFERTLSEQTRTVAVRRLDTLFADGLLPKTDFLKVDVEGYEKEVFLGARELIMAGVLGVEMESSFDISPIYPESHFIATAQLLVEYHLQVFDFAFNRVPRASFQRALQRHGHDLASPHPPEFGAPSTLNVLFGRDLIAELDHPENYVTACRPVSIDQIIKLMIMCELHGLNDIALDTAERFADRLGSRFDIEHAVYLLADPNCRPAHPEVQLQALQQSEAQRRESEAQARRLLEKIRQLEESASWRITAPLRAVRRFLTRN
jgi:FkbM family methyltransferase